MVSINFAAPQIQATLVEAICNALENEGHLVGEEYEFFTDGAMKMKIDGEDVCLIVHQNSELYYKDNKEMVVLPIYIWGVKKKQGKKKEEFDIPLNEDFNVLTDVIYALCERKAYVQKLGERVRFT